jgi:AAA+ superfamily predicted ATPase
MEKFFEHNPGFSSRIPYTLNFEDYNDDELLEMLRYKMSKFFKDSIDVEGGVDGLYMRIIVRRLGRGRGRDGFGNARALENLFARIRERQADRLSSQRRQGLSPDDFMFTKEDLIGPDPSQAILKSEAWTKLQKLTGLKAVKNSISFMIDLIKTNYERELKEVAPVEVSLNRVFLGSPGTGKTTVANLYGRILADIGLLSNGEVVTKNPADFIGNVIGQSEANTKAILATTVGKVLIIDEAYMLYSGASTGGAGGGTDIYKTAVIDTIVAEVQSVPGEDRCVLLLGYEDQMVEMFQNVNPGLTRRFQLSDAFHFEDFNDAELQEILEYKLKIQDLSASPQAVSVAIDVLSRARNGLNFGNGGDVENLISKAKSNYQSRQSKLDLAQRSTDFVFEPQDFDPDFDRAAGAETNLQELFKDVIGCAGIISKLDGYLKVAKGMKAQGLDPRGQIPMNFIFKGPPGEFFAFSSCLNTQLLANYLGTGKTTTARKFGQVYYDLGFLSQVEVVECSATDLIGQYVGQTSPKTIKQLERGLGKVLFIDEAYRLGEGLFAQEAVNELVDTMTKPKFAGKLVIILAGYDNDMKNLLQVNEGLSSRFADEIIFPSLNPSDCIQLLEERLKQNQIAMPFLKNGSSYKAIFDGISELAKLPAWGNARDIQTLAKSMVRDVYQHNTTKVDQLTVSIEVAQKSLQNMLSARCSRNNVALPSRPSFSGQVQQLSDAQQPPSFNFSTSTATKTALEAEDELPPKVQTQENVDPARDTGVSDEIWAQLQLDKKLAELRVHRFEAIKQEQEKNSKLAQEAETEAARQAEITREQKEAGLAALRELEAKIAAETEAKAEALLVEQAEIKAQALAALKRREEERIKMLEAQAERERIRKQLERREMIEREKRKKEQQAQAKLKQMGVCPVGYQWIKQSGGYRCAGGSHWVTDGQLGL